MNDTFHRRYGKIRQINDQILNKTLTKHDQDVKLRHDRIVGIEIRQKDHSRSFDNIRGSESVHNDMIHPRIRKLAPFHWNSSKKTWMLLLKTFSESFHRRITYDVVHRGSSVCFVRRFFFSIFLRIFERERERRERETYLQLLIFLRVGDGMLDIFDFEDFEDFWIFWVFARKGKNETDFFLRHILCVCVCACGGVLWCVCV